MANILDYVEWRGDLTLEQSPFGDIDGLILSWLSYVPFGGIVSRRFSEPITLKDAAQRYLESDSRRESMLHKHDLALLSAVAQSERFGSMRLSGYISRTDREAQTQFAAITIALGSGAGFLSFRGTDDTLIGWKENFNMAFMTPVPAQRSALRYLERAADVVAGGLLLGGHSKGGNLAAYAASFCPLDIQQRIVRIYNNDGPGFPEEVVNRPGYQAICGRIKTFVPQTSVVGLLMEHEEDYTVIHSQQTGFMQHDLYTWEVMRDHFVCLNTITKSSRFMDKTLKRWVADMEPAQRGQVIDALYGALQETQATTISELTSKWFHSAAVVRKSYKNMDEETRKVISQTFSLLFKSARNNMGVFKPTLSLPFPKKAENGK